MQLSFFKNSCQIQILIPILVNFQGKAFRPKLIMNMADAVNAHLEVEPDEILEKKQYEVAMISEMYHTSSLYHDDVIDNAEIRHNGAEIIKNSHLN